MGKGMGLMKEGPAGYCLQAFFCLFSSGVLKLLFPADWGIGGGSL
jgi:hypothetical protein